MTGKDLEELVDTISTLGEAFVSPNETDRNGEVPNIVDGLFEIARGLQEIAAAIRERAS